MNYKNAFNCKKCPQTNTEQGCPMWWEFMQTDTTNGREQLTKMCGYQALPIYLIEVIKASNRPAAEIGAMRCEIAEGMNRVVEGVKNLPPTLLQLNGITNGQND
jgi:hypothetical protein